MTAADDKADRVAEAWVRKNTDHRLSDTRKGRNTKKVVLTSPQDSEKHFGDLGDARSTVSGLDSAVVPNTRRKVSLAEPEVPISQPRPISQGGIKYRETIALNDWEYEESQEKLDNRKASLPCAPLQPPSLPAKPLPTHLKPVSDAVKRWTSNDRSHETYLPPLPVPPRKVIPLCWHCNYLPAETVKVGLCRPCQRYRTSHQGQLPPPKILNSRKRKRGIE